MFTATLHRLNLRWYHLIEDAFPARATVDETNRQVAIATTRGKYSEIAL